MSISDAVRADAQRLVERYPVARAALLPLLHLVQSDEGFVSDEGVAFCARMVGISQAEAAAVATFYTMYKRHAFGDWLLSVCTNPTCKIAGGGEIWEGFKQACGPDRIDRDGAGVMVEEVECLGICDAAPVVQVNYEMYGPLTPNEAMDLLAKAKSGEPSTSPLSGHTPGPFREVARELSGVDDAMHDHLVEAARLQASATAGPTYRTGETDLPVTHPGGDPAGHGGKAARAQAHHGRERRASATKGA